MKHRVPNELRTACVLYDPGAFYWRLWSPVFIGVFFGNLLADVFSLPGTAVVSILTYASLFYPASDQQRMRKQGTLTPLMLLPCAPERKKIWLLLFSAALPFTGLWTGAALNLTLGHGVALAQIVRFFPFFFGVSILLGMCSWKPWSPAPDTNVPLSIYGGALLFLIMAALGLFDGAILIVASAVPYLVILVLFRAFTNAVPDVEVRKNRLQAEPDRAQVPGRRRCYSRPGAYAPRYASLFFETTFRPHGKTYYLVISSLLVGLSIGFRVFHNPERFLAGDVGSVLIVIIAFYTYFFIESNDELDFRYTVTLPVGALNRVTSMWVVFTLIPVLIAAILLPAVTFMATVLSGSMIHNGPGWGSFIRDMFRFNILTFVPASIMITSVFLSVDSAIALIVNRRPVRRWLIIRRIVRLLFTISAFIVLDIAFQTDGTSFFGIVYTRRFIVLSAVSLLVYFAIALISHGRTQWTEA